MQSSERCISVPFSPSVLLAFARIVYVVVLAKADAALAQDASPAPFAPSWDATPEQHFEPAALPENGPPPGMATPIESDEDRAFALRLARQMAGRFSLDFNLGTVSFSTAAAHKAVAALVGSASKENLGWNASCCLPDPP
jgi:hypothetical protein